MGKFADETLSCPVMVHIGASDDHIKQDQIDAVKNAHPDVPLYLYADAGHGFYNSYRGADYNAAQAGVARGRTLEFLAENLHG